MYLLCLFATLAVSQVLFTSTSETTSTRTITLPAKTTAITVYSASLSTWTGIYTAIPTPTTTLISTSTTIETPMSVSLPATKITSPTSTPPLATPTHSSVCVDSTNSILYDCFTTAPPSISSTTTPTTTTSSTTNTPTATTAYRPTTTMPTITTHNQPPTPALTTSTTSPTTSSNNPNPLNGGYAGAEVSYLSGGPSGQREGSRAGSRILWCMGVAIATVFWDADRGLFYSKGMDWETDALWQPRGYTGH